MNIATVEMMMMPICFDHITQMTVAMRTTATIALIVINITDSSHQYSDSIK